MNLIDLRKLLEQTDLTVQYRAFKEGQAPSPPYILFYEEDNDGTIKADNFNYYPVKNVVVELYTDEKDIALEDKLEQILIENNIEYDNYESYIESEDMFEIIYEIVINPSIKMTYDFSKFNEIVEKINKLNKERYTTISYNALKNFMDKSLSEKEEMIQSKIDSSTIQMLELLSKLEKIEEPHGYVKGENLLAPLYWASINRTGYVSSQTGEIDLYDTATDVVSDFIKIPDDVSELSMKISESSYIYFYSEDNEDSYISYEIIFSDKTIQLSRKSKYVIFSLRRQTSDSIKNIQAEWGSELSEWKASPLDEEFLNAKITNE